MLTVRHPGWARLAAAIAAASLLCGAAQRVSGQTLVTHRIPATLAIEAITVAVAACTQEGYGAIGVGGAPTAEADEACARAGLDKIRDRIR